MTGIEARTTARGARRYRGVVYDRRTSRRQYSPWGATLAAARSWRRTALAELEHGARQPSDPTTLREFAADWLEGAKTGSVRDRRGRAYKPATLRGYERGIARVLRELGDARLTDLRRADVQALVDRLVASGLAPSTVRNTLDPLRAIYRHAIRRDLVSVNPTTDLDVPHAAGAAIAVATHAQARALLAALPPSEQALWATALYAGLRRGELRALRWTDVDLPAGTLRVARAWDDVSGEGEPKTAQAKRTVPVVAVLRAALAAHAAETGREGHGLVFGTTADVPFEPSTVRSRALAAWTRAGLPPITLHACRHTAASLMIAAGANAKALSVVMGHASIEITFNRYGKLMPGGEAEVGQRLDAYLSRGEALE